MTFWIVVYCLHFNRCYVSQDVSGPRKYETAQICQSAIPGKEIHKNSQCVAVHGVTCHNGGSACTFAPADDEAAVLVTRMVAMPQQ